MKKFLSAMKLFMIAVLVVPMAFVFAACGKDNDKHNVDTCTDVNCNHADHDNDTY